MKYCSNCGTQLQDDARFCPNCGAATGEAIPPVPAAPQKEEASLVSLVALVFMILSCVAAGWLLIPLCWMIPMTVSYNRRRTNKEPVSTAFKICTLLFVNLIAGILMIVDDEIAK